MKTIKILGILWAVTIALLILSLPIIAWKWDSIIMLKVILVGSFYSWTMFLFLILFK